MGSTEKRGKHSGKFPNYGDDKMVTQGFREMNLNVYDSDDWLVINKEPNVRAMNDPRVAPNPTHGAWGQPAMLGRPRAHEQASWSNFHAPGAGFMCRPPNMLNNGMVMGNLAVQPPLRSGLGFNGRGDYENCYDGMRSKDNGCVSPIVLSDSSDDEEKEDDVSDSDFKCVTNSKAQTKGVSQGLTSDSRGDRGAVPSPFMRRVNAPSGVLRPGYGVCRWNLAGGVMSQPATQPPPPLRSGQDSVTKGKDFSEVSCYDGDFTSDYEDEFSDEDADWENGVPPTSWSHQNGYPVHGQVGVDPRLGMHRNVPQRVLPSQVRPIAVGKMPPPISSRSWNVGAGADSASSQAEVARHGRKKEVHCDPSRSGQDFVRKGEDILKVNCYDGGFTTENEDEFSDEDVDWEDGVTPTSCSHQSGYPVHGQVGVDPRLGMHRNVPQRVLPSQVRPIAMGIIPPPIPNRSWNVGVGAGSSQAEAARLGHKRDVQCDPSNIKGTKSTHSHGDAKKHLLRCGAKQKYLQNPYIKEFILPGSLNGISGANSGKMSAKNGGQKKEFSEADLFDSDDEEDSQFDDNECKELESRLAAVKKMSERPRKELEENFYMRQTSKFEKDEKEKDTKKVAEQSNSNMSFFEDYKNRVKEVAKLVKSHITSKHEGDTSADVGKQLMKIQEELLEMKKRHREEEQELHKQYDAALKQFMEKQAAADYDSDDSDEL